MSKNKVDSNESNYTINIRFNSLVLNEYKSINAVKYGIKSLSKACVNSIKQFDDSIMSDIDTSLVNLSYCDVYSIKSDKKFSFKISKEEFSKFQENCEIIGVTTTDCIKKLIMLCVKTHLVTVEPDDSIIGLPEKLKEGDVSKFNLWCSREEFSRFVSLYSKLEHESSPSVSLNDILYQTVKSYRKDEFSLIKELSEEKVIKNNNTFKYNFTVSNKRYIEFLKVCRRIGVSPLDCVRKSMSIYIKKKEQEISDSKNLSN